MDRAPDDGGGSPRIDIRALPDSVARLWETMLRLDPSWDLADWLDERANEELGLVEGHLGRERLRLEQRLHRLETLVKRLKRQREVVERTTWTDPNQRNLFDVFEKGEVVEKVEVDEGLEGLPAVDFGSLEAGDDPLLAIVAEHVISIIEKASDENPEPVHFDSLLEELTPLGIRADEVDEAVAWLLQRSVIVELGEDAFGLAP
ncbi:MAG: hypothetical protein QF591_03835 [Candidatus Thalassarchaeum sp.]|jgi:hypothetical protein|uniref:hypothetical protein n=1 Tax=Candidatus Thalassarchaeum betae TaxID=2599289 RepID=UPI00276028F4|nr:hypothetical protein [Candidatus Thalassoarchaea betae]MDP7531843.1 hypothetical protein [Candidatus Thalassarchaeum sp.]